MLEGLVLETTHCANDGEDENGEATRSYLLSEPIQEAIEGTIFEGVESWPELRKRLFRFCQREYGRCTSKVYIDVSREPPSSKPIGWVFERKEAYQDAPGKHYTREVWVTVLAPVTCDQGQRHLRPVCLDTGLLAA